MVRFCFLLLGCFSVVFAQAQTEGQPVAWKISHGQEGDVHLVLAEADIAEGWYVYSQFLEPGGPIPTSINLNDTDGLTLTTKAEESGKKTSGFDALFEMEVTKFSNYATFSQAFSIAPSADRIKGYLEFMACTEKKCLPPQTVDIDFAVEAR